jgi:toxin-antitoxin system PIN domain toxin
MRALLDVNVLIALLDAAHVHHGAAVAWLCANIDHGWASCPITQNGCIRILSQPGYPSPLPPVQVAERLREATGTGHHRFWADSVSLLDGQVVWRAVLGARQVTDAYLLALAVREGGRFVTFDRSVSLGMVQGATAEHLAVI